MSASDKTVKAIMVEFEVAKFTVAPGDIVVVRTDVILSRQQADQLHDAVRAKLPEGVRCLVLSGGLDLSVLTKAEIESRAA